MKPKHCSVKRRRICKAGACDLPLLETGIIQSFLRSVALSVGHRCLLQIRPSRRGLSRSRCSVGSGAQSLAALAPCCSAPSVVCSSAPCCPPFCFAAGHKAQKTYLNFFTHTHTLPALSSLICSVSLPLVCPLLLSFIPLSHHTSFLPLIFVLLKALLLHIYLFFVISYLHTQLQPPSHTHTSLLPPSSFFFSSSLPPSLPPSLSILPPCALVLFELKCCKSEIRL